MEKTLAVNCPQRHPIWEHILYNVPLFLMLINNILIIFVTVKVATQENTDPSTLVIVLAALILNIYMFFFVLDNNIRLFHSQETIKIQDDNLVLECTRSFMRRYKSIPLSSIRQVEHYDGSRGSSLTVPDTLRIRYGRHGRYRFAINMSYNDSSRLAKKIMSHVDKQKTQQNSTLHSL